MSVKNGLPGVSVQPPTATTNSTATTLSNLPTGAGNGGPVSSWGTAVPHSDNGTITDPVTGVVTTTNITQYSNGNLSGTKTTYDPNTGLKTINTIYNGGASMTTTAIRVTGTGAS